MSIEIQEPWYSPQAEETYILINRVYSRAIKKNHPYIKFIQIDPTTYNDLFTLENKDKYTGSVTVIVCADWNDDTFVKKSSEYDLGKDLVYYFSDLKNILLDNVEILTKKFITVELDLNKEKYCYDKLPDSRFRKKESKKIETKESEINERCWKGYTQKGMKTMFGKRYPNCVKKTNR